MWTVTIPSNDLESFNRLYIPHNVGERFWSMLQVLLGQWQRDKASEHSQRTFSTLGITVSGLAVFTSQKNERAHQGSS